MAFLQKEGRLILEAYHIVDFLGQIWGISMQDIMHDISTACHFETVQPNRSEMQKSLVMSRS